MSPRKREPDLVLSIEEITPEVATQWMEFNTWNRKISERLILTYAETMKEGAWVLNGEPIIPSRHFEWAEPALIDGGGS